MSTPSRYWREIPQRYRLEANMCGGCGTKYFPPRLVCSECKSQELEPARLANRGQVLTYTIIHTPPAQFVDQAPYAMAIVELEDGVKLTAQIVDVEFEELEIGLPVKIEFRKISESGESGILCYGYKFVPER